MLMAVLAKDYIYGFIITPNGPRGVFTSTPPDDFILCTDIDVTRYYDMVSKLGTIVYDRPTMRLSLPSEYHTVCVVRYTSDEALLRMLGYAEGYPCSIIENLGGKCDYEHGLCWLKGAVFFCSAGVLTIYPVSSNCAGYLKYCLLQESDFGPIECRGGKIYYNGAVVGECRGGCVMGPIGILRLLWSEGKVKAEDLVVYNNVFHFMCTYARQAEKKG